MKKILVPVDGSSNSMRAVKFAIAEARDGLATIHLLHVLPSFDDYGMVRAYISERERSRFMKAHSDAILRRASMPMRKARVGFELHAAVGDVATRIVDRARRLKCASIVMGTRGMGSLGNLVLGSIATKVIHRARIPVTLVK